MAFLANMKTICCHRNYKLFSMRILDWKFLHFQNRIYHHLMEQGHFQNTSCNSWSTICWLNNSSWDSGTRGAISHIIFVVLFSVTKQKLYDSYNGALRKTGAHQHSHDVLGKSKNPLWISLSQQKQILMDISHESEAACCKLSQTVWNTCTTVSCFLKLNVLLLPDFLFVQMKPQLTYNISQSLASLHHQWYQCLH